MGRPYRASGRFQSKMPSNRQRKKGRLQASGPSLGRKRPRRAAVRDANHVPRCNNLHRNAQNARGSWGKRINSSLPWSAGHTLTSSGEIEGASNQDSDRLGGENEPIGIKRIDPVPGGKQIDQR